MPPKNNQEWTTVTPRQFHQLGCFWSKVTRNRGPSPCNINCHGMLHRVILCFGMYSCTPAHTKSTSHMSAGKLTYRKEKEIKTEKNYHIPHLKGRSKHWDMLLTQRYMLAHIPLTKINILASVLTFTSTFSSHLNHYSCCIYSSLPSLAPCHVHTLPSASTSFLSYNRSQQPFISSRLLSRLCQWQQPWSLSYSPPQHIRFHPSL